MQKKRYRMDADTKTIAIPLDELMEALEEPGMSDLSVGDPMRDEMCRELENRIFVWNDEISDSCMTISAFIQRWNAEDKGLPVEERKPIRILINTDGGDANAALHLIDIISVSKTPVYTIGMGKCFSAGLYLLMAGHKRMAFKNTTGLLHEGEAGTHAIVNRLMDFSKYVGTLMSRLKSFALERTRITSEQFDKLIVTDCYMTSEEMLDYGVIDKIVTDIDEVL